DAVLNSIASSSKVTGKLIEAMAAASSAAVDGELGQGSAAGGASSRTVPQSRSDEMIYNVDDSAPPMMRMSSKARGKMADDSEAVEQEGGWAEPREAGGSSSSGRPSNYHHQY
ncbi:hypothetical protein EC988_009315, partial [Linderina pennispora]